MRIAQRFTAFCFTAALGLLPVISLGGVGEGQELYEAYCVVCHGGLGEGQTMGKPLTDSMANRLSDEGLIGVITNGRSGTGMASWGGTFKEQEILDIASYVRMLQGKPGLSLAEDNAAGNANDPAVLAGKSLFEGVAGCVTCHSYKDQGGAVGPALDGIGSRLSDAALQEALLNPSASIASGYAAKEVEQQDGTVIRGRFRNDSALAIQLQSEDGKRWVTYFKDRVKAVRDTDESLMPDVFATLSAAQQQQLMAFLKSL
jgi:putative heme-binding domain-containing protein